MGEINGIRPNIIDGVINLNPTTAQNTAEANYYAPLLSSFIYFNPDVPNNAEAINYDMLIQDLFDEFEKAQKTPDPNTRRNNINASTDSIDRIAQNMIKTGSEYPARFTNSIRLLQISANIAAGRYSAAKNYFAKLQNIYTGEQIKITNFSDDQKDWVITMFLDLIKEGQLRNSDVNVLSILNVENDPLWDSVNEYINLKLSGEKREQSYINICETLGAMDNQVAQLLRLRIMQRELSVKNYGNDITLTQWNTARARIPSEEDESNLIAFMDEVPKINLITQESFNKLSIYFNIEDLAALGIKVGIHLSDDNRNLITDGLNDIRSRNQIRYNTAIQYYMLCANKLLADKDYVNLERLIDRNDPTTRYFIENEPAYFNDFIADKEREVAFKRWVDQITALENNPALTTQDIVANARPALPFTASNNQRYWYLDARILNLRIKIATNADKAEIRKEALRHANKVFNPANEEINNSYRTNSADNRNLQINALCYAAEQSLALKDPVSAYIYYFILKANNELGNLLNNINTLRSVTDAQARFLMLAAQIEKDDSRAIVSRLLAIIPDTPVNAAIRSGLRAMQSSFAYEDLLKDLKDYKQSGDWQAGLDALKKDNNLALFTVEGDAQETTSRQLEKQFQQTEFEILRYTYGGGEKPDITGLRNISSDFDPQALQRLAYIEMAILAKDETALNNYLLYVNNFIKLSAERFTVDLAEYQIPEIGETEIDLSKYPGFVQNFALANEENLNISVDNNTITPEKQNQEFSQAMACAYLEILDKYKTEKIPFPINIPKLDFAKLGAAFSSYFSTEVTRIKAKTGDWSDGELRIMSLAAKYSDPAIYETIKTKYPKSSAQAGGYRYNTVAKRAYWEALQGQFYIYLDQKNVVKINSIYKEITDEIAANRRVTDIEYLQKMQAELQYYKLLIDLDFDKRAGNWRAGFIKLSENSGLFRQAGLSAQELRERETEEQFQQAELEVLRYVYGGGEKPDIAALKGKSLTFKPQELQRLAYIEMAILAKDETKTGKEAYFEFIKKFIKPDENDRNNKNKFTIDLTGYEIPETENDADETNTEFKQAIACAYLEILDWYKSENIGLPENSPGELDVAFQNYFGKKDLLGSRIYAITNKAGDWTDGELRIMSLAAKCNKDAEIYKNIQRRFPRQTGTYAADGKNYAYGSVTRRAYWEAARGLIALDIVLDDDVFSEIQTEYRTRLRTQPPIADFEYIRDLYIYALQDKCLDDLKASKRLAGVDFFNQLETNLAELVVLTKIDTKVETDEDKLRLYYSTVESKIRLAVLPERVAHLRNTQRQDADMLTALAKLKTEFPFLTTPANDNDTEKLLTERVSLNINSLDSSQPYSLHLTPYPTAENAVTEYLNLYNKLDNSQKNLLIGNLMQLAALTKLDVVNIEGDDDTAEQAMEILLGLQDNSTGIAFTPLYEVITDSDYFNSLQPRLRLDYGWTLVQEDNPSAEKLQTAQTIATTIKINDNDTALEAKSLEMLAKIKSKDLANGLRLVQEAANWYKGQFDLGADCPVDIANIARSMLPSTYAYVLNQPRNALNFIDGIQAGLQIQPQMPPTAEDKEKLDPVNFAIILDCWDSLGRLEEFTGNTNFVNAYYGYVPSSDKERVALANILMKYVDEWMNANQKELTAEEEKYLTKIKEHLGAITNPEFAEDASCLLLKVEVLEAKSKFYTKDYPGTEQILNGGEEDILDKLNSLPNSDTVNYLRNDIYRLLAQIKEAQGDYLGAQEELQKVKYDFISGADKIKKARVYDELFRIGLLLADGQGEQALQALQNMPAGEQTGFPWNYIGGVEQEIIYYDRLTGAHLQLGQTKNITTLEEMAKGNGVYRSLNADSRAQIYFGLMDKALSDKNNLSNAERYMSELDNLTKYSDEELNPENTFWREMHRASLYTLQGNYAGRQRILGLTEPPDTNSLPQLLLDPKMSVANRANCEASLQEAIGYYYQEIRDYQKMREYVVSTTRPEINSADGLEQERQGFAAQNVYLGSLFNQGDSKILEKINDELVAIDAALSAEPTAGLQQLLLKQQAELLLLKYRYLFNNHKYDDKGNQDVSEKDAVSAVLDATIEQLPPADKVSYEKRKEEIENPVVLQDTTAFNILEQNIRKKIVDFQNEFQGENITNLTKYKQDLEKILGDVISLNQQSMLADTIGAINILYDLNLSPELFAASNFTDQEFLGLTESAQNYRDFLNGLNPDYELTTAEKGYGYFYLINLFKEDDDRRKVLVEALQEGGYLTPVNGYYTDSAALIINFMNKENGKVKKPEEKKYPEIAPLKYESQNEGVQADYARIGEAQGNQDLDGAVDAAETLFLNVLNKANPEANFSRDDLYAGADGALGQYMLGMSEVNISTEEPEQYKYTVEKAFLELMSLLIRQRAENFSNLKTDARILSLFSIAESYSKANGYYYDVKYALANMQYHTALYKVGINEYKGYGADYLPEHIDDILRLLCQRISDSVEMSDGERNLVQDILNCLHWDTTMDKLTFTSDYKNMPEEAKYLYSELISRLAEAEIAVAQTAKSGTVRSAALHRAALLRTLLENFYPTHEALPDLENNINKAGRNHLNIQGNWIYTLPVNVGGESYSYKFNNPKQEDITGYNTADEKEVTVHQSEEVETNEFNLTLSTPALEPWGLFPQLNIGRVWQKHFNIKDIVTTSTNGGVGVPDDPYEIDDYTTPLLNVGGELRWQILKNELLFDNLLIKDLSFTPGFNLQYGQRQLSPYTQYQWKKAEWLKDNPGGNLDEFEKLYRAGSSELKDTDELFPEITGWYSAGIGTVFSWRGLERFSLGASGTFGLSSHTAIYGESDENKFWLDDKTSLNWIARTTLAPRLNIGRFGIGADISFEWTEEWGKAPSASDFSLPGQFTLDYYGRRQTGGLSLEIDNMRNLKTFSAGGYWQIFNGPVRLGANLLFKPKEDNPFGGVNFSLGFSF